MEGGKKRDRKREARSDFKFLVFIKTGQGAFVSPCGLNFSRSPCLSLRRRLNLPDSPIGSKLTYLPQKFRNYSFSLYLVISLPLSSTIFSLYLTISLHYARLLSLYFSLTLYFPPSLLIDSLVLPLSPPPYLPRLHTNIAPSMTLSLTHSLTACFNPRSTV